MKKVIISILAVIVCVGSFIVIRHWQNQREQDRKCLVMATRMSLASIRALGELAEQDCGSVGLFTNLAFISVNPGIAGWRGPYSVMLGGLGLQPDPWGIEFRVSVEAQDRWIVSAGPDRNFETGDDIKEQWPRNKVHGSEK